MRLVTGDAMKLMTGHASCCEECGQKGRDLVQIGALIDTGAYLCIECLKKAVSLLRKGDAS